MHEVAHIDVRARVLGPSGLAKVSGILASWTDRQRQLKAVHIGMYFYVQLCTGAGRCGMV